MVRPRPTHTQGGLPTAWCNRGGRTSGTRTCLAGVLTVTLTAPRGCVMSVLCRCDPELGQCTSSLSAESLSRRSCCVWIHPVVSTAADTHCVKPSSSYSPPCPLHPPLSRSPALPLLALSHLPPCRVCTHGTFSRPLAQADSPRTGMPSTACASLAAAQRGASANGSRTDDHSPGGALCPATVRLITLGTLAALPRRGTHIHRPGVTQPEEGQPLLSSRPGSLLQRTAPRSALCRPCPLFNPAWWF